MGSFVALLDEKGEPIKPEITFQWTETPPVQTNPPRPHPVLHWTVVILFIMLALGLVSYRTVRHYLEQNKKHVRPASTHMMVVEPPH
ncbi:MAG: hypothetical protein EPN23_00985 [Verrucomicrobia bacterium]|nr:MAG: hypothetical protein EPN23_00985 [Verrucomicrobiota bacterium]